MSDMYYSTHQSLDGGEVTRVTGGYSAPTVTRLSAGVIQGVTRYTSGEEDMRQEPVLPSLNRVDQGTIRDTVGQGLQEFAPVTRGSSDDLAPTNAGIIGTVRNNAGFPTSNITPNCTVEIPGFGRTSVKVAVTLGYLSRTADGGYVGASSGNVEGGLSAEFSQQPATQQQQQQDALEGMDLFDERTTGEAGLEEKYAAMIEPIPQGTYDSMLASATVLLGQGQGLDAIVGALTSRHGSDILNSYVEHYGPGAQAGGSERAAALIKSGAEVWQRQADSHIKAGGLDPSDLYEWARENRPDALKQALQGQFFGRSLKGYTDLMNDYYDNVPPTAEALNNGGIPTKVQGGKTLVQIGGMWMTLDSAVKGRMV